MKSNVAQMFRFWFEADLKITCRSIFNCWLHAGILPAAAFTEESWTSGKERTADMMERESKRKVQHVIYKANRTRSDYYPEGTDVYRGLRDLDSWEDLVDRTNIAAAATNVDFVDPLAAAAGGDDDDDSSRSSGSSSDEIDPEKIARIKEGCGLDELDLDQEAVDEEDGDNLFIAIGDMVMHYGNDDDDDDDDDDGDDGSVSGSGSGSSSVSGGSDAVPMTSWSHVDEIDMVQLLTFTRMLAAIEGSLKDDRVAKARIKCVRNHLKDAISALEKINNDIVKAKARKKKKQVTMGHYFMVAEDP